MKSTCYLAALALFGLAASAQADVTVNVTGATAFRAATLLAIKSRFVDSGAAFKFAHDQATSGGTTYSGATRAIFIGTFPGVTGTTTIRCCFTGSVEGIRALIPTVTDPLPPTYYQPSLLTSTTAVIGGAELAAQGTTGAAALGGISDIAYSDVSKAITPYAGISLQPSSPPAGVVVFTMLTNEGSTISNVTAQQFRGLMSNGFMPKSVFTGLAADNGDYVFATGRNDGSGTRSSYLTETGYGVSNTVKQYVTNQSTGSALSVIQLVPVGGVNTPALTGQSASNASTVWGQNIAGNGGYNSGSTLRTDMGKTSAAVEVLDETGANIAGSPGTQIPLSLVTWLSVNDAVTARSNGAVFCAYNGVKLDGVAASGTDMTIADRAKVAEGAYTAWNFENMYLRNDVTSGDKLTVYNGLKAEIPTNLGAAGIALTAMHVGRPADGGTVAP